MINYEHLDYPYRVVAEVGDGELTVGIFYSYYDAKIFLKALGETKYLIKIIEDKL